VKQGEAKVGQRVRTLREFEAWPTLQIGSLGTIKQVLTQHPGAETDAIAVHFDDWPDDGEVECQARDVELVL
jgi:hypothetical protein